MRSRLRGLTALVALLALSLFLVEGVWASLCSVDMEMSATSGMAESGSHEGCPMGQPGHSHEQDGGGSEGPACPLMPAGGASCTVGVALPPHSDEPALGAAVAEPRLASSDHAKDLLLAVSLLRPPRA